MKIKSWLPVPPFRSIDSTVRRRRIQTIRDQFPLDQDPTQLVKVIHFRRLVGRHLGRDGGAAVVELRPGVLLPVVTRVRPGARVQGTLAGALGLEATA